MSLKTALLALLLIIVRTRANQPSNGSYACTTDQCDLPTGKDYLKPISPISAKQLVQSCPALKPSNRSPPPSNGEATLITFRLRIGRLNAIADIDQTMSVSGTLQATWRIDSCPNYRVDGKLANSSVRIPVVDTGDVWHPALRFRNSVEDFGMQSQTYFDRMELVTTPKGSRQDVYFFWKRYGTFMAVCQLDMALFPVDTQQCHFQFTLVEASSLIDISQASSVELPSSDGAGSQWSFIGGRTALSEVHPNGEDTVKQVTFSVTLKRRPTYYIFNVVAPPCALAFLSFTSYFIPPELPDRALFNVYLILAFAATLSQVLGCVPETPQLILLNSYTQLLASVYIFNCLYSIGVLWLMTWHPERMEAKVLGGCAKLRILLDLIGIVCSVVIFIGATVYATKEGGFM